jgi:hypothetical protein
MYVVRTVTIQMNLLHFSNFELKFFSYIYTKLYLIRKLQHENVMCENVNK